MPDILSINEIIEFMDKTYPIEQQKEILKILFGMKYTLEKTPLLNDLLDKGIIQLAKGKFIKYRLKKFFEKKNITKISLQKDFIFSKIPNYNGLKRGKAASYDDLVSYIEKSYLDLFDKILVDFPTYEYTPSFAQNGDIYTLYLNRKLNIKANYKFNPKTSNYELKNDEVTPILREHNINFDVDDPNALFAIKLDIGNTENVKTKNNESMPVLKKVFLIIFWPIGLYYLLKRRLER